eukprot:TRINITY_DN84378_c0_g1_i1.p1 TRINITY_DN84378_c0_g1~~TRINITY_DN84378_c0_g1_i1.p1  ORF type:complete len:226 (-),score=33.76 TRINITY_DN84378_c0_g1_i1:618-1295(-)
MTTLRAASKNELPQQLERKETRSATEVDISETKQEFCGQLCVSILCCCWLPVPGFLAAGSTLETCEQPIDLFLKIFCMYGCLAAPVSHVCYTTAAYMGNRMLFKAVQAVLPLVNLGTWLYFLVAGWDVYRKTTDAKCYDRRGHSINPRSMLYLMVLLPVVIGVVACILSVMGVVARWAIYGKNGHPFTEHSATSKNCWVDDMESVVEMKERVATGTPQSTKSLSS